MTAVLGINSYFEHPAVALVRDGEIIFAVEDERFTGIKHGRKYSPHRTYLPVDSMYRALADTGSAVSDLGEIAYSYHRWRHLGSLWGCFTGQRLDSLRDELTAFASLVNVRRAMRAGYEIPQRYRGVLDPHQLGRVPYREWPHHLSHAASAFFCSGFDEALVVVADGAGERAATSVYHGRGAHLRRIGGANLPHSLGIYYSVITRHLGFEPFADEFKVMGLSAYGEPRFRDECRRLLSLGPSGTYQVSTRLLGDLRELFGPARTPGADLEQRHRDIARSAQDRLEEALEHVVRHYVDRTGLTRICYAGGTFLNCVANGRLARLAGVREVFVQPASHDAGTALGAAILSAVRRGSQPRFAFPTAALGTAYDETQVTWACQAADVPFQRLPEAELAGVVADRLAAGEIGGIFRGRMEFGPRALGLRSILADPRDPEMRDRLNRLKGREGFRPVAPMVTAEAFAEYFDGHQDRFMLFSTEVRPGARTRIPAAVHADGTARVQTVRPLDDPWLHGLLVRFAELTGVPVLINTSLNVRGKPIVESPLEALSCLFTTGMDFLVLGGLLVAKPDARERERAEPASEGARA